MARGYLVIADITGYTAYLNASELEHARDTLSSILRLLLEHTRAPLVLSRLEGDAVISYALEDSFLQGQTIVEMLETTYVAFRRALDIMVLNTTCDCRACRNIDALDLKFFVHHGEFLTQELDNHVELIGNDVNLVHRLTKNSIARNLGVKAYAAYTEAAARALDLPEFFAALVTHSEHYEHLGAVRLLVQDMEPVWERERDRQRLTVEPEDALVRLELLLPVDVVSAWEYITKPEFRNVFGGARSTEGISSPEGRLGRGGAYLCVHGRVSELQPIVDWQPFVQYTFEGKGSLPGVSFLVTVSLEAITGGTRFVGLMGRALGPLPYRWLDDRLRQALMPRLSRRNASAFLAAIDAHRRDGRLPSSVNDGLPGARQE